MVAGKQAAVDSVLRTVKGSLVVVLGFSLALNLLMLAVPLYMLQVYDRVLSSRSTDTLMFLTLITLMALATLAVLELIRGRIMLKVGSWIELTLAGKLLSGGVTETLRSKAEPSVQNLRDLSTLRLFFSGPSLTPFLDAPWTPIFLLFVYLLHPVMGMVAVIGALALFGLGIANELTTRHLMRESSALSIQSLNQAEAAVRNADAIDAMGMLPRFLPRWNAIHEHGIALQEQAGRRSVTLVALSKFLRLVLQVLILAVGAWLALYGAVTPGAIIAGSILMARALAPMEQSISSWRSAVAARDAYERLNQHLRDYPEPESTMTLPAPSGHLRVESLGYQHPTQTGLVLQDISFELTPGESLGLIGPSGSGKSTLARLILGNLVPGSGSVRLDHVEISQWHSGELGVHCGYLPQDIELFTGTVKENIARMGEGDPRAIIKAARLAGCHDLVLHLPKGYETQIGDRGSFLSGGMRQRIGLARALYGDPKLVVLDEPNSNLDGHGERALMQAMYQLKKQGVTVVIVGHRPSILQFTDKILVLDRGRIQKLGPRDVVFQQLNQQQAEQREARSA